MLANLWCCIMVDTGVMSVWGLIIVKFDYKMIVAATSVMWSDSNCMHGKILSMMKTLDWAVTVVMSLVWKLPIVTTSKYVVSDIFFINPCLLWGLESSGIEGILAQIQQTKLRMQHCRKSKWSNSYKEVHLKLFLTRN